MRLIKLIALMALAVTVAPAIAQARCSDTQLEMRGDFGSVRFRVVVADTPQERAQGLMRVPEMPRMSGMFFVYERPQSARFWMENTLIPLDMIFADETGVVQHIHENAIPLDRTPISGGDHIQYVLEINGGMSAVLGLSPGDEIRHPAIAQNIAAWPCTSD